MFRLSLKSLSLFCRQVGAMLEAGVPLRRSLETVQRVARGRLGRIARDAAADVDAGRTFAEALDRRGAAFPPLARNLVRVGERTGALDSVLVSLADFFEMLRNLYRRILGKMVLPLLQFYAAVGIVAFVAWFTKGLEESGRGTRVGAGWSPVAILLVGWGGPPAAYLAYRILTRALGGARIVHEFVLRVPVAGRVARAFAIGRFAWCMSLCSDTGMSLHDAIVLSMQATGNAAFAGRAGRAVARLREGEMLNEALADAGLFPLEFVEIVAVGEESGKLSESFAHQARQYFENARMGASALGMVLSGAVWVAVAAFIIIQIFALAGAYFRAIPL